MPVPMDTALLDHVPRRPPRVPDIDDVEHRDAAPLTLPPVGRLAPGDAVEVQNRFDGRWSPGFEIVDVLVGMGTRRYRIRRLSDGAVLPRLFVEEEVDASR